MVDHLPDTDPRLCFDFTPTDLSPGESTPTVGKSNRAVVDEIGRDEPIDLSDTAPEVSSTTSGFVSPSRIDRVLQADISYRLVLDNLA